MSVPSPLAFRDYRFFWLARFCAVCATTAMVVVIGWQVYDLARTHHNMSVVEAGSLLSLIGLAQFIPVLIFTPIAGWTADRMERRTVARMSNLLDLLIALILGWFTYNGTMTLPLLFSMAALHGAARVFLGPATSAITPNIIPSEVFPRAIAMNSIAWQSASVIGPAAGGWLLGFSGSAPYWLAAILLGLAALSFSQIRPVHPPADAERKHPLREMLDGLAFTWRERFLLATISLDLFAVLLGGATALLPIYARDILHVGPEGLGQMRAAPALGAALVALGLSFRPIKENVGVKMLWSVVLFGAATIVFGLSTSYILSLASLAILGGADMFSVFIRGTLVQLNTPDAMRGRVSSVSGLAISASNELGEVQSGLAIALLHSPVGAVVFGGIGAIMVTGLWAWLFPELKNARTFEPQFKDKKA